MTTRTIILVLLVILMALGQYSPVGTPAWIGFVYGLPLLLALLIVAGQRWALMACVMHATVGLALDIATIVQDATAAEVPSRTVIRCLATAITNALLITLAGKEFMYGAWRPRSSLPPNPPPPPASGSA